MKQVSWVKRLQKIFLLSLAVVSVGFGLSFLNNHGDVMAVENLVAVSNIQTGFSSDTMLQTERYLFVNDEGGEKILVFDNFTGKNNFITSFAIDGGMNSMLVYAYGSKRYLFVARNGQNSVLVIDANKLKVLGDIVLPPIEGVLFPLEEAYWMAQDGNRLVVTQANVGWSEPFFLNINTSNPLLSTVNTVDWGYPNGLFYLNTLVVIDPIKHYAYFVSQGSSPSNVVKFDISPTSSVNFLLKSKHGDLGSNTSQLSFAPDDYSKLYLAPSVSDVGYQSLVVNTENLTVEKWLQMGSYPNAMAVGDTYIYAGKDATYDDQDVKIFSRSDYSLVSTFSFDYQEELLKRGISVGSNVYAVTEKAVYRLDVATQTKKLVYEFCFATDGYYPLNFGSSKICKGQNLTNSQSGITFHVVDFTPTTLSVTITDATGYVDGQGIVLTKGKQYIFSSNLGSMKLWYRGTLSEGNAQVTVLE